MAKKTWSTKFLFAAIPMRYLPTKELRAKANKVVVEAIAWDSVAAVLALLWVPVCSLFISFDRVCFWESVATMFDQPRQNIA